MIDKHTFSATLDLLGTAPKWKEQMKKEKISPNARIAFAQKIIASDVFDSSEKVAIAILQEIIDNAKKDMVIHYVNVMARNFRKEGRELKNKKEAVSSMLERFSLDEDSIDGAIARELGVRL